MLLQTLLLSCVCLHVSGSLAIMLPETCLVSVYVVLVSLAEMLPQILLVSRVHRMRSHGWSGHCSRFPKCMPTIVFTPRPNYHQHRLSIITTHIHVNRILESTQGREQLRKGVEVSPFDFFVWPHGVQLL